MTLAASGCGARAATTPAVASTVTEPVTVSREVESSEAAPDYRVVPIAEACWNHGTDACFVVNVTPEEDTWASFRRGSFHSDASAKFSFDDVGVSDMLRAMYLSMKQASEPSSEAAPRLSAQVTVVFDAATPPSRLQQAVDALKGAGLSPIAAVQEDVLDAETLARVRALSAVEIRVHSGGVPDLDATLRMHELSLRACFLDLDNDQGPLRALFEIGHDGRIHRAHIRSALPEPTRSACTEYDDYMGRCVRDTSPGPNELLDTEAVHCLQRGLRALPAVTPVPADVYDGGLRPTTEVHLRGPAPVHVVYPSDPNDRVN